MTKIPILSGIYATPGPDFRQSYPVNMMPVPLMTGINDGYLRPADGIVEVYEGPGHDRGGICWNGRHYRAMGTQLIDMSGLVPMPIGNISDGSRANFDYGPTYLAVASGGLLYLCTETSVQQVTDPDLGTVLDVIWIDGFYMTTDGAYLVVTDLNDPFAVNPLKYGSSEADPDPIVALLKLRNEAVAVNRHTIEFFDNIGGSLFPFQRIEGAQIQKGAVGTNACCVYEEAVAFLGSGKNENLSVYVGNNGVTVKVGTDEIDMILSGYSDLELAGSIVEARSDGAYRLLYVHLPDRTLVYDGTASQELKAPVWHVLTTATSGFSAYEAAGFTLVNNEWFCGYGNKVGRLDKSVSTHWGRKVRWEFGTIILYNEGKGALFHELELVALTGSVAVGGEAYISSSYSVDGVVWSQDRIISAGANGQRGKRLVWFQQGMMRNWRVQRFKGDSDSQLAPVRLEARLEPLEY